ncbi:MAG: cytochrome c [Gammaproteobacteria bacterium]|nr:cytochrome c [Gammaproteobacteria bacterium]
MNAKKQSFKTGEKVLFGIFGVFVVLAVIAYAVLEAVRLSSDQPMFGATNTYEFTEQGALGSVLFREARCTSCHRALRNGTNMGLSLDGTGSLRSYDWIYNFLKEPEKMYDSSDTLDHGPAPKEAAYVARLPDDELKAIAKFISQLKAERGSSSAPMPPEGRSEFIDSMVKTWAPKEWTEKYSDIRTRDQDSIGDVKADDTDDGK